MLALIGPDTGARYLHSERSGNRTFTTGGHPYRVAQPVDKSIQTPRIHDIISIMIPG